MTLQKSTKMVSYSVLDCIPHRILPVFDQCILAMTSEQMQLTRDLIFCLLGLKHPEIKRSKMKCILCGLITGYHVQWSGIMADHYLDACEITRTGK